MGTRDTSRTSILPPDLSCIIVTPEPGPSGGAQAFRQPLGPNNDPVLTSYLRIEERELEAGGLN